MGKISPDAFQKNYFQWAAVQLEIKNFCKEKPLVCPACTPEMLVISVDGNRKHYRFKSTARYFPTSAMGKHACCQGTLG